ncbi:hypothetical protein [Psychromonas arctica]|uniref:hypothetical protein n=1 Tax=Psychromonas arctica TaxID=168275 RepID=UPI002FCF223D
MKRNVLSILVVLFLNTVMLFQGIFEGKNEISSLMAKVAFSETFSVNALGYFTSSLMSNQVIVGLCLLIFYFFPTHRAAVVSQKAAIIFCDALYTFVVTNARGCRAPPQV